MVALLHPLNIFILGLGGGFVIPLLNRAGTAWASAAFTLALTGMALIAGVSLLEVLNGAAPIEILTGGSTPPYSINLRVGLMEGIFAFGVSVLALLGTPYFVRGKYVPMSIYLILIMGIQGMIMTRDLFNLFVFLEIVSIATYGLLSLNETPIALSATFKYLMATVIASTFFLLGTVLLYAVTGMLNIDDLIDHRDSMTGPVAFAALMFLLASLLIELKPFPANGWGLDVYETAPGSVAALVSVGVSSGVLFAFIKLLPLFNDQFEVIAFLGATTFLLSNLIGLRQTKAQRLLGYSSVGQMGLLTFATAMLSHLKADAVIPLVVAALFVNHLLAKAGLFWLAEFVGREHIRGWSVLANRPVVIVIFAILLTAIAGLPPFPSFWAKWHLIISLANGERHVWIAVVLLGSLLEAAYLFRWFGQILDGPDADHSPPRHDIKLLPSLGAAFLLVLAGCITAVLAGAPLWGSIPLLGGLLLYALDWLPGRGKCVLTLILVLVGGTWLVSGLSGINSLFAVLLLAGGLVLSLAFLNRDGAQRGFYPLLTIMLLSLPALPRASTSLEFLFIWELITLSSYFLMLHGRHVEPHALRYLLFSLASAFFLLAGFATANAVNGTTSLAALRMAGPDSSAAFALLLIGLLIKAGAVGVHVWLPGAYAGASDDLSAMMSAVVSKAAVFGLLVGTFIALRSDVGLNLSHALGWVGMITTLVGAALAMREDDVKRMLAYSSMSQLGYIVTAIALMSHLGWVTALYLTANHVMVKGTLFLAAAAIILRTGTRTFADLGGLARFMPWTFLSVAVAALAMSGLPPLAGFGGKWLLLSAMMEKGWYGPTVIGLLATFFGLLYTARFIQVIFLDPKPAACRKVKEAPFALLVPQYVMIAGILVMSFWPKLLIEPVSRAIDPDFASTLVWNGMSLKMIYAFWNPLPVMAFALAVSAALFVGVWSLQRINSFGLLISHARASVGSFHDFWQPLFVVLTPPWATVFWAGVAVAANSSAEVMRKIYSGNGQIYCVYIFYYFLTLYLLIYYT